MARRPKLTAPTPDELAAVEAPAARPASALAPPIAQVASEAARIGHAPLGADAQDAEAWRRAEAEGRVIRQIDLGAIEEGWIARDRAGLDAGALDELIGSIRDTGLRLPLEVSALGGGRYGLVSGYRRLMALRHLAASGGEARAACILVEPGSLGARYARMVEENEIRADLSPYERGRVAVIAAGQGAYADVGAAVTALFAQASKAKRSKIRAFALVHETLGDLMQHGADLSEKAGLSLAAAIRAGGAERLRAALEAATESGAAEVAEGEWAALSSALDEPEAPVRARGGRPKAEAVDLGAGARARLRPGGLDIRGLDPGRAEAVMEKLRDWLAETS